MYKDNTVNEVHLRHLTVDEALLKLDEYLNDAFMSGLYQVRVIHGKGTGTLRQVVVSCSPNTHWLNHTVQVLMEKGAPELL